ncbi:tyrosine-type recombinase/integrase [Aliiruegeria lutimaris]|uniref:Integrase n=1 Tax=Aliiruegeria lutimaris TaxID=571298 RepID=A0A1G9GCR1_9RHOB|nr:site-specific integrase [Aliiruegeria lutimaris]SDK98459.1 Integrase [Aliiruegeria lutimaris]
MAKLTDGNRGTIAKAELPAKGQRFVFDDHRDAPRGFGLRITAAGGKAFILKYSFDGRERRKTIGDWPTWTLEAARAEARDLSRDIAQGKDPLEAKRRRRQEPLLKDLAGEWLDKHASGLSSEKAIRGYINNDLLPAIGNMKVSDIRRRDVIEVIEDKAEKTPRAAAQVLIYARRLMDYATDRDYIPANPLAGLKPSSITVKGKRDPLKAKVRARVLDHDEIRAFWINAETCDLHRLTALALKMVLVTGQRPGEVSGMREDEISGRWWTIPAARRGKTDSAHTVYLTDAALKIVTDAKAEIERLSRRRDEPWSGFIFEARPGRAVTNAALCRAVDRQHVALGAKTVQPWGRWTPHDLRRTMRTGLSACRVRPDIAELTIGHVKGGIIAVYDQHSFDAERQVAWEAWESRLLQIVAGKDPDTTEAGNVLNLERTRA